MRSSPRARLTEPIRSVARRARRRYEGTPLRVKLVAIVLLLVVGALAGSGVAAAATLHSYLIGRVDSQLASVRQPITEHDLGQTAAQGNADQGGKDGGQFKLPSAYVVEVTNAAGEVVLPPTSNLPDSEEPLPRLPQLVPPKTPRTFTVHAVRGDQSWRVLAAPITLSDGSTGTLLIAQSLGDVQKTINRLALLFLGLGAVAVVVLAGVGYVVVRVSLRPLREVEHTAGRIAGGDLSCRVPEQDARTEVGQLAGALNTMLTEIETAFAERAASEAAARRSEDQMRRSEAQARLSEERMRRFIADASHELRTPLTSIRGFAELYRQGAAKRPEDVRRAMGRIEDEAKRMGLLVEDLLLLARLDEERPLDQAPVDVLALANDAVHDAQASDPERHITLEVVSTDPPPVVIGDEARLRQVLGNLLTNTRKHTPPGTQVTVRVSTGLDPGSDLPVVTLEVADEGPGMTSEHAARVFERFFRADSARNRSAGNTGLGLAIVAALVAGHGGTVDVLTAPGAGARFRVTLPLAAVPTAGTPTVD